MAVVEELFEPDDPLEKAPTLTLYLLRDGEQWVRISSEESVIGTQLTCLLQMSQDYRPILKRKVNIGERLTYHVKKEGSPSFTPEIPVGVKTSTLHFYPSFTPVLYPNYPK